MGRKRQGIYLDYNASTPVDPRVVTRMTGFLTDTCGNPSSIHRAGRTVRKQLEEAREELARAIGAHPKEIVFTSGGTEADNLAIAGAARCLRRMGRGHHLITTAIEHSAVIKTARALERDGFDLTVVSPDDQGIVQVQAILDAIRPETCLISVMLANNETGAIQPVAELKAALGGQDILIHTDAVQAFGKIPMDVEELGVDLLSLSSHKIYGPKGAGCLYVRKGIPLEAVLYGGTHERGLRAGTEAAVCLVGFAEAARLIDPAEWDRLTGLRDRLRTGLFQRLSQLHLNSPDDDALCVPNTLNVAFEGIDGEALLLNLDLAGLCVSGGSACASGALEPSHVLTSMGVPRELARSSIRFSLGRQCSEELVDRAIDLVCRVVEKLASKRISAA